MVEVGISIQDIVDNILIIAARGLRKLAEFLQKYSNRIAEWAKQLLLYIAKDTESRLHCDNDAGLIGAVKLSFLRNGFEV